MRKKPTWWVSSAVAGNEIIAQFFSEHAVHESEVLCRDVLCADGRLRDLWRLTGEQVKHFRGAAAVYTYAGFRFFIQDSLNGKPRAADFLMKKRASKKVLAAKARLEVLKRKRAELIG